MIRTSITDKHNSILNPKGNEMYFYGCDSQRCVEIKGF